MGIFQKYKSPLPKMEGEIVDPLADVVPVVDAAPVVDIVPPTDALPPADVSDEDRYDEQRQQLNNRQTAIETLTSELEAPAKVDGQDDDMAVDGTKTGADAKVAEGDFGKEVEITDTKDGVHADADDSEVKFSSELDQAERDVDAELDMIEQDSVAIESLMSEITMLSQASEAISVHGFNPTAAAIAQCTGLLNGTALDTLALESINFTNGESDESRMALEALGDKIKDKAAAWSAKILSVAKNSGEKILSVLNPLYTKLKSMISGMASSAWDKTKAVGGVVKAHPYKSAAAVVASVVAVAGVLSH